METSETRLVTEIMVVTDLCSQPKDGQNRGCGDINFYADLRANVNFTAQQDGWFITYPGFLEREVPQLIHSQRLKRSVEERDGMQPLERGRDGFSVDQQPREHQAEAK